MGSFVSQQQNSTPVLLDGYISVQDAAEFSSYNVQYLRRMMQNGVIEGIKVGQVWLIKFASLQSYLNEVERTEDRRFGPRSDQAQLKLNQQP